jgi:uncharacterized protein YbaP (TraB family)
MKKIFSFFAGLLTLLINFSATAQKNTADNKSLLWKISGKELVKPSYLFGTIHMICADDFLWTAKMKTSLDNSEKVCLEMDLDDPSVMMEAAAGLMDPGGKKLKDYFTPEQYKLVSKYVKDSLGIDIAMLEQMKPIALQTLMSSKSTSSCGNQISYEDSIMKMAQKDNKEILGLETPKEQLDALESIPADTVVNSLLEAIINNNQTDDAEYAEMIHAYKNQDIPALYTLITKSKEPGEDMGVFLDQRNKKWISRMQQKMNTSSIFFAVGAGHLWGTNGVINLLKKQGYHVEPVK